MRYRRRGLVLASLLLCASAQAQSARPAAADTDKAKLSYAIGYQIGSQFADGKPPVAIDELVKAIDDAYAKRPPAVPMAEMHEQLQALEQQMQADARARFEALARRNAQRSADYLASNRKKSGVVQLPSGIQYAVIKRGKGAHPTVTSTVTVNYRGMLVDGTEFDSTWARGEPVSFRVDAVIPGWRDVIPRMRVGDRWKVVIPANLAYGKEGAMPRIGPNEALVFEIELLAIKPATNDSP